MQGKLTFIASLLVLFTISSFGQKNTLSPYSRYALGEMVEQSYGSNIGYGSISGGLRVDDVINYSNPASYTAQDTNSFIFDIGMSARSVLQKSTTQNVNRKTVGFDHIAIGFPVINWWKSSIGVVPLSHVGYSVQESVNTGTIDEKVTQYDGKGGMRQFYIGNAFDLTPDLSLGVNYFYVFGNSTFTSASFLPEDEYSGQFKKELTNYLSGSRFQLGLQYQWQLQNNNTLTAGASYDLPADMTLKRDRKFFSYYQYTTSEGIPQQDTIDVVQNTQSSSMQYPSGYNVGLTLKNPKVIAGADFKYQNWSEVDEFGRLSDSYSLNAGLQYTPDREALRNYLKRVNYRIGAFYKQSYLNINNQQLENYGITFGLGIPLKYNKTKFNLSLQLGRKGTTDNNLVEEDYAIVNFNITFYDFWFIKQKYQ